MDDSGPFDLLPSKGGLDSIDPKLQKRPHEPELDDSPLNRLKEIRCDTFFIFYFLFRFLGTDMLINVGRVYGFSSSVPDARKVLAMARVGSPLPPRA